MKKNALAQALFAEEGPEFYKAAFAHNKPFAKPGPYMTKLDPIQEQAFRAWVLSNGVPFDTNAKTQDYDMRGYWLANTRATHAQGQHFPDTYKTPYDTSFSNESKYAQPYAPSWVGNALRDSLTKRLVFGAGR